MHSIPRFIVRLALIALALTLGAALVPVPIERTAVDRSAAPSDSDYVTVHGLPYYFLVTDNSVKHSPVVSTLVRRFFVDWAFSFYAVSAIVLSVMFVALIARLAARAVLLARR